MKIKIITVATVILLLVVMSVPVYAETTLPAPPSDAYEYWVYLLNGQVIVFATSHNPITTPKGPDEGESYILNGGKYYNYIDNEWILGYGDIGSIYISDCVIVAANHDIAYEDGSGFFFECPKVSPLIQTMETTDFGTILRTFSAGLIPLIGCLILGISLVKAWGFLRTQLKH